MRMCLTLNNNWNHIGPDPASLVGRGIIPAEIHRCLQSQGLFYLNEGATTGPSI